MSELKIIGPNATKQNNPSGEKLGIGLRAKYTVKISSVSANRDEHSQISDTIRQLSRRKTAEVWAIHRTTDSPSALLF